jgi:O-antigen/teichoic acid export membrane protein
MTQQAQKAGQFSTQLAIASFAIGTALFLVNNAFHFPDLLFIGLLYIGIAFIINTITFFYLIYFMIIERDHKEYFLIKIMILLANIPVVYLYLNNIQI